MKILVLLLYDHVCNISIRGDTNIFASIGAGFASGLLKTVEGVVSLGAELVDLGADSNTAGDIA